MSHRFVVVVCVALVLASSPLMAQEFRAGISGVIRDPQGAVIPNVDVEAMNTGTNQVDRTKTNGAGVYSFPVLALGQYTVTASLTGFKKATRGNLELRTGDRVQLDLTLELGAIAEQVTVTGEVELLQTASASQGQVVSSEQVRDLPTMARNPFLLGIIATGVQFDTTGLLSRNSRPFDAGGNVAEAMTINGGRGGASDVLLDGVPNTATETTNPANMAFVPSPDATEEFKIQTNTYDSQYGRTSGGVISVSLKSGTNQVRGAVYWYFRNDKLNANQFELNRSGTKKSSFRWNQPGLELDGPVYIPHIYDGRNKTFFMYNWEAIRSAIPYPATLSVPLLEQRNGDFTTTLQSNGQQVIQYDPLSTVQTSPTTYTRTPFSGNKIPQNLWDPVAKNILAYIPLPKFSTQNQNLIAAPNPRRDVYDQNVVRIDQVISDKNRFFSRYVRGNRHEVSDNGGFEGPASTAYIHQRQNQGGNFDLTSVLSPTTVLTTRLGYSRHKFNAILYAAGFDPKKLGFPASIIDQLSPAAWVFPQITMSNYSSFGAGRSQGNQFTFSDVWSLSETVNRSIGAHSLKFGGEFRVMFENQNSPTSNFGTFSFTNTFTQANPLSGNAASGNAFAAFLMGMANGGQINMNPASAYSYRYYAGFLQDDWRLSRDITLNLGFRWDYESPVTERYDQQNAGFDYTAASPLQVPGYSLKGGLLFTDKNNRRPYQRDLNNFQPRVGLAWKLDPKTVLRSGYGLSYFATFSPSGNQGWTLTTPYNSTDGGVFLNNNRLSRPYPEGIRMPYGRSQGLGTLMGSSISFTIPGREIPKVHQFSLGLQRELPWRTVVEASYVGSRTKSLEVSRQIDDITAEQLAANAGTLSNSVTNPFAGLLTGSSINAATTNKRQLMRPYPQFTGISQQRNPWGYSWYNSLQVRVDKRFSGGLYFLASYTLSKNMEATGYLNNQDPVDRLERVLNSQDSPHRFAISGGWAVPFFNNTKGVLGILVKGWQMNAIYVRQVGYPLGSPGGYYSSGIDPALPADQRTRLRYFNTCTLTTAGTRTNCASADEPVAWIQQPPDTLRTLGSRLPTIRFPRVPSFDASMFKTFEIHESLRLQFRCEAFNLTNSAQLGSPSTSLSAATAGQVGLTQANDPRSLQLALRLTF